ncbi:MAG: hypothetical protein VZR73_00390 [Acutalibacteraceae bacterium]|nr:hypothetical protein [Acutalibacteraceae bacterium]
MASGRSYTTTFKTKAETQGIDEMQKKLQGLQKSLRDNQAEQKSLSKEIKDAEKEIKQIEKAIAKTGTTTEEQRKRLEQLRSTIESDRSSMEALKLQESQLRSQIEATNQQIEAERKALNDLKTSMGDAKTAAGDLTKEVAAIGAAATAAVAGLFAFTKSAAEWADSMNTMRDVTGISTSDLQKFTYAAELVDVSVETITGSLTKLTRNMQTAAGNGKSTAAQAFSELGVAVTDAAGQLRDRQEVFYEVIDALGKIENETQRDAYAMNVFGRTAEQLNPLIKGGAAALKEIGDEAERAGLILSQDTLNGLHAFNDKVDELKAKGTAIKELAAAEMTPALEGLVEVGNELLDEVQKMVKSGELKSIAKELGVAIKSGAEALKNIITFVWKFKEAIAAAVVGMVAFKVAMSITSLVNSLIVGFKALSVATKSETTEMAALNAVMNANPIGLVISLVAALTVGLGMLAATTNSSVESTERQNSATQEAVEKIDKYSEALQNLEEQQNKTVSSAEAEAEWIRTLQKGYEELRTKNELTGQEKERLIVLADELSKKLGIATSSIKDQTGAYRSLNEEIDTYIKNLVKQAELSGYEEILKAQAQIVAEINLEAQKAKKIWDEEQRAADLLKEKELEALKAYGKSSKEWQNAANAWASQYDRALDARNAWASWVMKLQEAQGELSETEDAFYSLGGVLDKTAEGVSEAAEKTTDFSKEMDDLQKQSTSLRSEMTSLANSMKQLENGEKLSLNTLLDLIEKYPEYAAELIAARDNAGLQRQALEHLFEAKKQEYILTLERAAKVANASNEETAIVLENIAKQIEGYQGLGNAMGNVAIAAVVANQIVAAALREQAQNLRESVSSYQQEIELIKSMKIGDFVSSSGSSGGNKTTTKEETKTFEKPHTWDYKGETYTSVYSYKEGEYDAVKDADTSAKAYLGVLDRAKTLGKLTLGEEISNLQSLLKWEKLSADQRYDIRVRLYKAQEQLAKENAEIEKKRDEEAQKRRDEADKALLDRQNLALAAYNKLVNGRIEALEAESDAARKSADEQIQALDDVMKKRKQEQDDAKRQKELDQINAKLRYQQLDEFERRELERRKQDILNEQADVNFERSVEAQKASLSAEADAVQSRNDAAIAGLNASKTQFADRMAYLQGSQTYDQRVANNTKTQNITIVQNGLSGDQLLDRLRKELLKELGA